MSQPMDLEPAVVDRLARDRRRAARRPGRPRPPPGRAGRRGDGRGDGQGHRQGARAAGRDGRPRQRRTTRGPPPSVPRSRPRQAHLAVARRARELTVAHSERPTPARSAEGGPRGLTAAATPAPALRRAPSLCRHRGCRRLAHDGVDGRRVMTEVRAGMLLVATPAAPRPQLRRHGRAAARRRRGAAPSASCSTARPAVPVARGARRLGRGRRRAGGAVPGRPGQHRGRARRSRCCATPTTSRSASARSTACSAWSTSTPRSSWSTARWPGCGSSPGTPAGAPTSSTARSRRAAGTSSRARPPDVFRLDPADLWRDVLRRQPGELAWHSTRPVDPTELNRAGDRSRRHCLQLAG